MKLLEADKSIERYLGAVEAGMAINANQAKQKRDEKAEDLLTHLQEVEPHLDQLERKEVDTLKANLDELRLQYALGKMEGAEKLHELKGKIDHSIGVIKHALHDSKKVAKKDVHHVREKLHDAWVALKIEVNLLELQLDLTKENTEKKLSAATQEVREDLKLIARLAKEELEDRKHKASDWIQKTKKAVSKRTHRFVEAMEHYFLDPPK